MTYDLALHGGTVLTAEGRRLASVYVQDGRIAAISAEKFTAKEVVDVSGALLLPGMIDGHVHFMDPTEPEREDFISGSQAAAVGGVTTVVEHTHSGPVRRRAELEEKIAYLRGRSLVDFGLAAHVWPETIPELPEVWAAGATYLKIFTTTTHGVPGLNNALLLEALQMIARIDATALLHCEDDAITHRNEERLRAQGEHGGDVIPRWRSRAAELVAVNTAVLLAKLTSARVVIAHASHPAVIDLAATARASGGDIWIETCPQYLLLDEDDVLMAGAFRKFTPPARVRSETDRQAMWRRVAEGPVTHISSDHAPSTARQKQQGLWEAPFGLPGVETTLPLLLDAVAGGRLSLERLVELVATTPAKLYGFFPRKGLLMPGADADMVVVDPRVTRELRNESVVSKAGWTPYHGRKVAMSPVMTFVRGRLVAKDGRPVADPGWGVFLPGRGAR